MFERVRGARGFNHRLDIHQRQEDQRRVASLPPLEAVLQQTEHGARCNNKQQNRMNVVDGCDLIDDLVKSPGEPPQDSPAEYDKRNIPLGLAHLRTMPPKIPGAEQTGDTDENRSQIKTIEHRY